MSAIVSSGLRIRRKRHAGDREDLPERNAQVERRRDRGEQDAGAGGRQPVQREARRLGARVAVLRIVDAGAVDRRGLDGEVAEYHAGGAAARPTSATAPC